MKPKILINASTLSVGGGVQIGVSLLQYLIEKDVLPFDYVAIVSKQIYSGIDLNSRKNLVAVNSSPASLWRGSEAKKKLKELEKSFRPDLIYSVGFPSYIKFQTKEAGRYTNPWEIFDAKLAWSKLSIKEKIKRFISIYYRLAWAKRAAYIETQTVSAKLAISQRLNLNESDIIVLPNSANPLFVNLGKELNQPNYNQEKIIVFCLSAGHIHKNLEFIPNVVKSLKDEYHEKRFEFILTLNQEDLVFTKIQDKAQALGVLDCIRNIGVLSMKECLKWYEKSHVVFLPTLLEVFSATYLEAMAMRSPIVTSNLGFAIDICGDAAFYIDPLNPKEAAKGIHMVVSDSNLRKELLSNGIKRLATFPSSYEKHEALIKWLYQKASFQSLS